MHSHECRDNLSCIICAKARVQAAEEDMKAAHLLAKETARIAIKADEAARARIYNNWARAPANAKGLADTKAAAIEALKAERVAAKALDKARAILAQLTSQGKSISDGGI